MIYFITYLPNVLIYVSLSVHGELDIYHVQIYHEYGRVFVAGLVNRQWFMGRGACRSKVITSKRHIYTL